ncbi:TolC family protein [Candidatus Latescibacterota bacterium]
MKTLIKSILILTIVLSVSSLCGGTLLSAGNNIELTLESAVDIAMSNSYRIQQLKLGIERTRFYLEARRASLKSRVYMNLQAPELNSTSEFKWNSTLEKDELVREDTRRWQMDLSVRQPVMLFGIPTNGYLSLNNKVYQYLQKQNGSTDVNYYNRYFVSFEQPLFQPNTLKNNIERAELDLQAEELEYIDDLVRQIDRIGDDYYELFELAYQSDIIARQIENLEKVTTILKRADSENAEPSIEAIQAQVELANIQEKLNGNQSDIRIESARMIQRLRLDSEDSLMVHPEVNISPISIDVDQAVIYGFNLRPRMQLLAISRRRNEIYLDNEKGNNSFRVNLNMTYGLEKQDEQYDQLLNNHDTSYSASVNAYIPIWDWGERKANIAAREITLQQTDLSIEESRNEIKSEIINAVANLEEYQQRALSMKNNMDVALELTSLSLAQFEDNRISIQDILQIIKRQEETETNFLEAYLGYRESILRLLVNTHYDYEKDSSLLDQFRAQLYEDRDEGKHFAENSDDEIASIGLKMPRLQSGM